METLGRALTMGADAAPLVTVRRKAQRGIEGRRARSEYSQLRTQTSQSPVSEKIVSPRQTYGSLPRAMGIAKTAEQCFHKGPDCS